MGRAESPHFVVRSTPAYPPTLEMSKAGRLQLVWPFVDDNGQGSGFFCNFADLGDPPAFIDGDITARREEQFKILAAVERHS